jgi:hypothetical protein
MGLRVKGRKERRSSLVRWSRVICRSFVSLDPRGWNVVEDVIMFSLARLRFYSWRESIEGSYVLVHLLFVSRFTVPCQITLVLFDHGFSGIHMSPCKTSSYSMIVTTSLRASQEHLLTKTHGLNHMVRRRITPYTPTSMPSTHVERTNRSKKAYPAHTATKFYLAR